MRGFGSRSSKRRNVHSSFDIYAHSDHIQSWLVLRAFVVGRALIDDNVFVPACGERECAEETAAVVVPVVERNTVAVGAVTYLPIV